MSSPTVPSSGEDASGDSEATEGLSAVVAQLLDRVRVLEDRAEIAALIASYGPLVDAADGQGVAGLWTEDGRYEVAGFEPWVGRESIAELVDLPQHQAYLEAGCAHFMGPPIVTVSGNEAVAVNYTTVFVRQDDTTGWKADRVSTHRWQLVRTAEGWRVQSRDGQAMDGSASARSFLDHILQ